MDIEVKGHSGCSIDIVREGKELFCESYTSILKARNRAINYDRCTTLNDYREV